MIPLTNEEIRLRLNRQINDYITFITENECTIPTDDNELLNDFLNWLKS